MKERDKYFDVLKGILIVMVVIRHILQYQTSDEGGILTNIIWAIQMPGFFMISGYFSRRMIREGECLALSWLKKVRSYFLPLVSWYLIVETLILGGHGHNVISATVSFVNKVDSTLWFLWVVMILCLIYTGLNHLLKQNCLIDYIKGIVYLSIIYAALLALAVFCGIDFLGIKYILYYSVFYIIGYIAKFLKEHDIKYFSHKTFFIDIGFAVSMFGFSAIVFNFDLYNNEDNLLTITMRVASAIFGICILMYIVKKYQSVLEKSKLVVLGKYTLEIYTTHMVFHHIMNVDSTNSLNSVNGILNFSAGLILCSAFTFLIIVILKSNKITNMLFYGK